MALKTKNIKTTRDSTKPWSSPECTERRIFQLEHNLIPHPGYEAPITTPFGYTLLVKPEYLWSYNPSNQVHKPLEAERTSGLGPLVASEINQSQISTSPIMVPQNITRYRQNARRCTLMSRARNKFVKIQKLSSSFTQLALSAESSTFDGRFKRRNSQALQANPLNWQIETYIDAKISKDSPIVNVLSKWTIPSKADLSNSTSRRLTHKCFIKWLLISYVQGTARETENCLSSEAVSIACDGSIVCYQKQGDKECLRSIVEYFSNITSQLEDGFYIRSKYIRYPRNAVLGKKRETTPLKNFSTPTKTSTN